MCEGKLSPDAENCAKDLHLPDASTAIVEKWWKTSRAANCSQPRHICQAREVFHYLQERKVKGSPGHTALSSM